MLNVLCVSGQANLIYIIIENANYTVLHFWKLSSKRKYHMYFRSALLMPDLVFLKWITWITSSKRQMILPVVLKWKLWLLLLCLNCSHIRYCSIFRTKIISQNKIRIFFFFLFLLMLKYLFPFCFMCYLLISIFQLFFFIYRENFISLSTFAYFCYILV